MPGAPTSRPNSVPTNLYAMLADEILLLHDCFLVNIPGGGRGIYLNEDHVLLWSTGLTYKLVQGDWIEVRPDSIPLFDWLRLLRESLEKRQELLNKRIGRQTNQVSAIKELLKLTYEGNLSALVEALSQPDRPQLQKNRQELPTK